MPLFLRCELNAPLICSFRIVSNIVKLLCCISNDYSKLLVYEYSNNHSLDQWLHRKIKASTTSSSVHHVVLEWPKRLQIAVVAS
jgi:serine/threonine protein kinase